jgi:RNA polymerase sigma-70 factor, ECF subfamily
MISARSKLAAGARGSSEVTSFPVSAPVAEFHQHHLTAVVANRDTSSFIVLFNYFAPRIKAYMKKLGASDELAEELAQDVMFTVWRKSGTYDAAKSAVSSWVFTIARNLRIDSLRREQRRVLDPEDPMLAPSPTPLPDAELNAAEQRQLVRAALGALPREQAAVVSLAFYDGKSHGEIAATLAIPLGTVKSRLRLAFERIRHALEEAASPAARPAAMRLPPRAPKRMGALAHA